MNRRLSAGTSVNVGATIGKYRDGENRKSAVGEAALISIEHRLLPHLAGSFSVRPTLVSRIGRDRLWSIPIAVGLKLQ